MVVVWPLLTGSIVRVTRSATSLLCRRFVSVAFSLHTKLWKTVGRENGTDARKGCKGGWSATGSLSSQIVHRQMPYDKTYSLLPLLLCTKGTRTLTSRFLWILNRRWFHEEDRLRDSLYLYSQHCLRKITYLIAWIVWNISKSCHCKTAAGHQSAHIWSRDHAWREAAEGPKRLKTISIGKIPDRKLKQRWR